MVKELSFDEGRNTMIKFLDAFCQARAPEVFAALERFKQEPSMLPLLTGLYNRIRPALYLGIFAPAGGERIRSALEIKEYALKMGREALRRYSSKALTELSFGLLMLSWKEKTSFAEGWPGFESLLMTCMASAEKRQ
jgi:DNA polymerase-3 subunit delta